MEAPLNLSGIASTVFDVSSHPVMPSSLLLEKQSSRNLGHLHVLYWSFLEVRISATAAPSTARATVESVSMSSVEAYTLGSVPVAIMGVKDASSRLVGRTWRLLAIES